MASVHLVFTETYGHLFCTLLATCLWASLTNSWTSLDVVMPHIPRILKYTSAVFEPLYAKPLYTECSSMNFFKDKSCLTIGMYDGSINIYKIFINFSVLN